MNPFGQLLHVVTTQPSNTSLLHQQFQYFIDTNEDPKRSLNYQLHQSRDSFKELLTLSLLHLQEPIIICKILKILKIITRKQINRTQNEIPNLIETIVNIFSNFQAEMTQRTDIACEGSNIVLNICYEKENVICVVNNQNCLPYLVSFLEIQDSKLQIAATGALQRKIALKQYDTCIKKCVGFLTSHHEKALTTRALGLIHNLTTDVEIVQKIRLLDGIPNILKLLNDSSSLVATNAANCIQNLCREDEARGFIKSSEAVPLLTQLLFSNNLNAQLSAAGALLNILSDVNTDSIHERRNIRKIMSLGIVVASLSECIEEITKSNPSPKQELFELE